MALTDYRADAMRCTRCSYCKWIPFDLVKSHRFAKGCPSVEAGKFHAYSAGGKLVTALSLMDGRSEVTDQVVDIAFRCQLCGNCDVTCKLCRYDMEPILALRELRAHLVEMDRVPESYRPLIERTRAALAGKGPVAPADRNAWAEGLGLKDPAAEPVDVVFYAGCKYSLEESLREAVRTQVRLLQLAGLSVGLFENGCCGGLADKMGYRAEAAEAGRPDARAVGRGRRQDRGHALRRLPPHLHPRLPRTRGRRGACPRSCTPSSCTDRLVKDERLELTAPVPMTVTYHDPCNLGRQGEPYTPWEGVETKIYGQAVVYDPPRPRHNGAHGVYQAPRDLLAAIPGVELVEMERSPARPPGAAAPAAPAARRSPSTPPPRRPSASRRPPRPAPRRWSPPARAASSTSRRPWPPDAASGGPGADLQVHDVLELVALSAGLAKEAS